MTNNVAHLLQRLATGDESALNELVTTLYGELHRIADWQLRGERPEHTLQATALVNEAYLKLMGDDARGFVDRAHFLAVASRVMRQVLVDYARARAAKKRSADKQEDLPIAMLARSQRGSWYRTRGTAGFEQRSRGALR